MTARSSVISSIVRKSAEAAMEENPREAVETERQVRARPPMLTVVRKNGDEDLLSYALLRRAQRREGGRKWVLVFDDCDVTLTGRNLGDWLRDMLRMHRLSTLREGNLIEEELTPVDEAFIEHIDIKEKD